MTPSQIQTIKQAIKDGKKVFWWDGLDCHIEVEYIEADTDQVFFVDGINSHPIDVLAADIYIATGWTSLDE